MVLQIFIPMRDPRPVAHWFLLVVHLKEETTEIYDSAPNEERDSDRLFFGKIGS